jgi:hypothetical protein
MVIKASTNDLLPENNLDLEVIPQVITNDADVFICSKVCSFQRTQLELGLSLPDGD